MAEQSLDDVGLVLELAPQASPVWRLDRLAPTFEVDPPLLEVLARAAPSACSLASWAWRAEPVSTPCGPDVDVGELDARDR